MDLFGSLRPVIHVEDALFAWAWSFGDLVPISEDAVLDPGIIRVPTPPVVWGDLNRKRTVIVV